MILAIHRGVWYRHRSCSCDINENDFVRKYSSVTLLNMNT